MRIRFTHGYEFLMVIVRICIFILVLSLASTISDLSIFNDYWILSVILWVSSFYGIYRIYRFFDWISTWCYVRWTLHTEVTSQEAIKLSFLFDGSLNGKWFPLINIKTLDQQIRREVLFKFANETAFTQFGYKIFIMPEDQKSARQKPKKPIDEPIKEPVEEPIIKLPAEVVNALALFELTELPSQLMTIKKIYRQKISYYHPDKWQGKEQEPLCDAEEMTKKLNLAYETLTQYFERP